MRSLELSLLYPVSENSSDRQQCKPACTLHYLLPCVGNRTQKGAIATALGLAQELLLLHTKFGVCNDALLSQFVELEQFTVDIQHFSLLVATLRFCDAS
ncbi:MAG: hypothetical protein NTY05_14275, partial [Rhodocyclales bacterium]|nr:hypothetical protein [Rhodocyclales bacterium]